jgi:type I restriction enzyme M protein
VKEHGAQIARIKTAVDQALTILWKAGLSDAWDVPLVLLFYKFVSDVGSAANALQTEADTAPCDSNGEIWFNIPDDASYQDIYRLPTADVNAGLIYALGSIETANVTLLAGLFDPVRSRIDAFSTQQKAGGATLKALLSCYVDIDFRKTTMLAIAGESFVQALEEFAVYRARLLGEYFTPREIIELMVGLTAPQDKEAIYDPACGTGSLLAAAADRASCVEAFGQEKNQSIAVLARINFLMHHRAGARIEVGDTLLDPKFVVGQRLATFDLVLCDPPFSVRNWGAQEVHNDRYGRFVRGMPPASNGDWAFISHIAASMKKDSGRAAIVVPLGVLFRGGPEARIRKLLIDESLVDAVVSLPTKLFPTTAIPFAILILRAGRETAPFQRQQRVLFIDARNTFQRGKAYNKLTQSTITRLIDVYLSWQSIEDFSRVVSHREIVANEYSLDTSRYFIAYDDSVDIGATQSQIARVEHELQAIRRRIVEYDDLFD